MQKTSDINIELKASVVRMATNIKKLILKSYRSIRAFCIKNGFNHVTIGDIIERNAVPSISTVYLISKALEVSLDDLMEVDI